MSTYPTSEIVHKLYPPKPVKATHEFSSEGRLFEDMHKCGFRIFSRFQFLQFSFQQHFVKFWQFAQHADIKRNTYVSDLLHRQLIKKFSQETGLSRAIIVYFFEIDL